MLALKHLSRCLLLTLTLASVAVVVGCDEEGPAEKAGKKVDQATESAVDTAKEAAEATKDTATEAAKDAGDAMKDAEEKAKDATK